jgi:hypothetical protein
MKKTIAVALFVLYYLISVMFFRIITVFAVGIHWKRKQQTVGMNGIVYTKRFFTGEEL